MHSTHLSGSPAVHDVWRNEPFLPKPSRCPSGQQNIDSISNRMLIYYQDVKTCQPECR